MHKLTIDKPDHPFDGKDVIITFGTLDAAYFHRGVNPDAMEHPVPVIILAKAKSSIQLMDILEADEILIIEV